MHQVDLHHYGLIRYYNDCIRKVPRWECGMPPQHTREWGRSSSWQDHPVGQGEIIARIRARWKVEGRGEGATQCCCCSARTFAIDVHGMMCGILISCNGKGTPRLRCKHSDTVSGVDDTTHRSTQNYDQIRCLAHGILQ